MTTDQELTALRAQVANTDAVLRSVACSSVQQLRDQYLGEMRRANERDLPAGFDSWEAYHAHIVAIRKERETLLAQVASLRAALEAAPSPICAVSPSFLPYDAPHTVVNFAAVDRWWVTTRSRALASTPETAADEIAKLRRDKARLDWLDGLTIENAVNVIDSQNKNLPSVRATIDAAQAKETSQ